MTIGTVQRLQAQKASGRDLFSQSTPNTLMAASSTLRLVMLNVTVRVRRTAVVPCLLVTDVLSAGPLGFASRPTKARFSLQFYKLTLWEFEIRNLGADLKRPGTAADAGEMRNEHDAFLLAALSANWTPNYSNRQSWGFVRNY